MRQRIVWAGLHRPLEFGPLPGVLLVPGLGQSADALERWREPVHAGELAGLGLAVLSLDLAGRGRTGGIESYGGPEHHADVSAALGFLAARVDVDGIGVISLSLGAAAVGAALASRQTPPIRFWIDWEGPSDREVITAGGRRMDPAQGHGLDDDPYWQPREAVRFVGETGVPYLRYQSVRDHAQPGELRHALRMVSAASNGRLPWFQLNNHPRNEIPATPTWMPPGMRPARKWVYARVIELMGLRR